MQITQKDKSNAENLLRALNKARFNDIEGVEVLALADVFKWASGLVKRIDEDLILQQALSKATIQTPDESIKSEEKSQPQTP